jgi:phosphoribosylanthranilate isomerase
MKSAPATKIKVCGVTRTEDARAAVACGASYIGLIFAPESPRKINVEIAQAICSEIKGAAFLVGVFKNSTLEQVRSTVAALPLDFVQFHGQETPDFCAAFSLPVIKTIEFDHVFEDKEELLNRINRYKDQVQYFLFDKPKGSHETAWLSRVVTFISEISNELPEYFFAGGLNADNVKSVLESITPYAVDVASGIESTLGIKDFDQLKLFCLNVNHAMNLRLTGRGNA